MPKPGPRTTPRYSSSFKATAVRLSQMPGVAVQDVAQSLYIRPFMLSRWRTQAREGIIVTKGVATDKEVLAELKELRRVKKTHARLAQRWSCLATRVLDAQKWRGRRGRSTTRPSRDRSAPRLDPDVRR